MPLGPAASLEQVEAPKTAPEDSNEASKHYPVWVSHFSVLSFLVAQKESGQIPADHYRLFNKVLSQVVVEGFESPHKRKTTHLKIELSLGVQGHKPTHKTLRSPFSRYSFQLKDIKKSFESQEAAHLARKHEQAQKGEVKFDEPILYMVAEHVKKNGISTDKLEDLAQHIQGMIRSKEAFKVTKYRVSDNDATAMAIAKLVKEKIALDACFDNCVEKSLSYSDPEGMEDAPGRLIGSPRELAKKAQATLASGCLNMRHILEKTPPGYLIFIVMPAFGWYYDQYRSHVAEPREQIERDLGEMKDIAASLPQLDYQLKLDVHQATAKRTMIGITASILNLQKVQPDDPYAAVQLSAASMIEQIANFKHDFAEVERLAPGTAKHKFGPKDNFISAYAPNLNQLLESRHQAREATITAGGRQRASVVAVNNSAPKL